MYITFISQLYVKVCIQAYEYDIGTWVRISKQRQTFSKGYLPNWSEEAFIVRVVECNVSQYTTYVISTVSICLERFTNLNFNV